MARAVLKESAESNMQEVEAKLATIEDVAVRSELERIRQLIKHHLPDVTEQISYGMPAFKYKSKYLIAYWAFKDHLSLFPGSEALAVFAKELGNHATSKGTVQFTLDDPISDELIVKMIDLRVKAIES